MRISDWSSDVCSSDLNDVTILAKDVRLTAASIAIDASVEEKNTVTRRKESYRYLYNYGHGTTSELSTPDTKPTVTGDSLDFSAGNFSYGTFRVGMAWPMFHFGAWPPGVGPEEGRGGKGCV